MVKEYLEDVGDNRLVKITKVDIIGTEIDAGDMD